MATQSLRHRRGNGARCGAEGGRVMRCVMAPQLVPNSTKSRGLRSLSGHRERNAWRVSQPWESGDRAGRPSALTAPEWIVGGQSATILWHGLLGLEGNRRGMAQPAG